MCSIIDYRASSVYWSTIERTLKDGTIVKQLRATLRYKEVAGYESDGTEIYRHGRKTKLYSAEESSKLNSKLKRKNAAARWIDELCAKQEGAAKRIAERERAEEEREKALQNRILLADYIEEYISIRELSQIIEASTASDYRHSAKRIRVAFPDVSLHELTARQVQQWEASELKRGITPTTVGKVHRLLKQVLTYAVKHEVIEKNIMVLVDPPKRPKKRPNGLDVDEAKRVTGILMNMEPTEVSTAAMLALHASLRVGEVCALTWANVDLQNKVIHITQAIGLADGKGAYLKPTKNDSSTRSVNITEDLAEKLKQRQALMREQLLALKIVMTKERFGQLFVCGPIGGGYHNPQVIARKWTALVEAFNVIGTEGKRLTFHGLRHAYATVGIASGLDVASIAAQMGHSTVSQTLNTYTSATASGKALAAETMGKVMHPDGKEAQILILGRTGTDG